MFNISRRILYIMVLLLITVVINAISMVAFIRDVRFDARAINDIGILRGMPQRIVKLEVAGVRADQLICRTDHIFAKYSSPNYDLHYFHIETSFEKAVYSLKNKWNSLKREIGQFRGVGGVREKTRLIKLSEIYWEDANQTVFSAESISEEKVSHLWFLFVPILLNLALIVVVIILLKKWVQNKLEMMAHYDNLSGLLNRTAFYSAFEKALENAKRYQRPVALLMLDLDRFKLINDTFGHDAGDEVIKKFARNMLATVRNGDFAARIGGEEFVVLAPETHLNAAEALAERIRSSVLDIDFPQGFHISVSIGIALYREGDTLDTLLKRSDQAMYKAKQNGRNRVELEPEED